MFDSITLCGFSYFSRLIFSLLNEVNLFHNISCIFIVGYRSSLLISNDSNPIFARNNHRNERILWSAYSHSVGKLGSLPLSAI